MPKPTTKPQDYYRLYPSVRLGVFILTLIGSTTLGAAFASFNFSLVCMVNETAISAGAGAEDSTGNGYAKEQQSGYDGEFEWDKKTLSFLIAAYGFGGFASNIPSGLLSDRYGSKVILAACVILNIIASLLTPIAAYGGAACLFFVRFLQGFACGGCWPAILAMVPQWGTPSESATLITLGATGYQMGPLLAMLTSSVICSSRFRWPLIFYVWSIVSGVFLVVWLFVYNDDPSKCRLITEREVVYIRNHNMRRGRAGQSFWCIPWKSLLFAPCALAVYISHFCWSWGLYFVSSFMPTYSKEVLKLSVGSNGLTSSLPFVALVVMRLICGAVSDRITFCGRSKTFSVKFFTCLCMMIPSLCFVSLGFLDRNHTLLAIAAFCAACGFMGTSTSGYLRGGVLMASRYSGATGALSNTTACIASAIMPHAVGALTRHGTVTEWQYACFLTAAVQFVGCVAYTFMGSAEEQKWAVEDKPIKRDNKVYTVSQPAAC